MITVFCQMQHLQSYYMPQFTSQLWCRIHFYVLLHFLFKKNLFWSTIGNGTQHRTIKSRDTNSDAFSQSPAKRRTKISCSDLTQSYWNPPQNTQKEIIFSIKLKLSSSLVYKNKHCLVQFFKSFFTSNDWHGPRFKGLGTLQC